MHKLKLTTVIAATLLSQIAFAVPQIEINTTCSIRTRNESGTAILGTIASEQVFRPANPRRTSVNLPVFFLETPNVRKVALDLTRGNRTYARSFMHLSEWVTVSALTTRGVQLVRDSFGTQFNDVEMVRLATYQTTPIEGFYSAPIVYGEGRLKNGTVQGFAMIQSTRALCSR